jgi:phage head maturation protease
MKLLQASNEQCYKRKIERERILSEARKVSQRMYDDAKIKQISKHNVILETAKKTFILKK